MALVFLSTLMAQRVPCVGDYLDADTLMRMQEHEAYLTEQMTQLWLQIEEKNMEQSRMGIRALLFAALPYWKIWNALCLLGLLFQFTWKIQKKFWGVEDSSEEESSSSEEEVEQQEEEEEEQQQEEVEEQQQEEAEEQQQEEEIDQSHFLPETLRQIQSKEDEGEMMQVLLDAFVKYSLHTLQDTFYPVPQSSIRVGSAYEGWCHLEDQPDFCLLVPLSAPRGHVFHLDLGTAGELPARNSRIRVELECTCGREQGMLCFLHSSAEELRNQHPSLLHSLCTGSYLDVEKTAHWFQVLIKNLWKCFSLSAKCSLNVVLSRRSCMVHLILLHSKTVSSKVVFGVQQDGTDIFLSSQETQDAATPSTAWPQSCAVAEAKFFKHIAAHAEHNNFYLRCMQVCASILVGHNFSTYELKTVLMHLLTTIPLESWHGRYFVLRMDDILQYLRCCLEEKRLDHFLIGNEAVPAEIILPQDFRVSRPLNLFQHLAQDPDKHEQALHELEELQDRLTRLLMYGK